MKLDRKFLLAALVLLLAICAAYSNHFENPFHFDDSHTIVNNIYIRDLHNIPQFFKDATTFSSLPANQSYRPVVTTTLAIDYWLGKGLNPFWFHLSTFLWFLLQGLLMYFLFKKIMDIARPHPWNKWFSLFTVAFYMLHTTNAETINYIISRSDLLSTLAIVAAMYIYAVNGWGKRFFLYLIPLGLGILTKPTSVMFIAILFVYIFLFETDIIENGLSGKTIKKLSNQIIHLIVSTVFCGAGYFFMDKMTPPTWTGGGVSAYHYIITQPYVMLHYFHMFWLPTELSADTDWTTLDSIFDIRFFGGMLFVLVMVGLAILAMRKKSTRPITFGIAWFFLALVPTSVIPLAEVTNDHRMLFPFVGLVLSVGWTFALLIINNEKSLKESAFNRALIIGAICLVLFGYGCGVYERNEVWSSDISLWKDVSEKSPNNGRGLMNYGLALAERGEYKAALKVYNQALKLNPQYSYLHINLAITLDRLGQPQLAEEHYKLALQYSLANQAQEANYFYGLWLAGQQRYGDAEFHLKRALEISPAYLNARYQLMDVLLKENKTKELKDLCDETLKIVPGDPKTLGYMAGLGGAEQQLKLQEEQALKNPTPETLLQLSLVYYNRGEYEKVITACQQAIQLKPDFAEAYNNMCSAYNQLKQYDKAVDACTKSLSIAPNYELAKNNLAWAKSQQK